MNVGESQSFAYTGTVQEWTVPATGLYKLEAWGAKGGDREYNGERPKGGEGGYTVGYKLFAKGTVLYIVCGSTTYNGGGNYGDEAFESITVYGSGGGATHIALISGTLASIGRTNFDTNGLIIAGGGGGGACKGWNWQHNGTAGNSEGNKTNTFGNGRSSGSGYYDGEVNAIYCYGGMGSFIGTPTLVYKGVTYTPSMTAGGNSGNGKATITLIAKAFPTIHAFGKDIVGGFAYGKEISDIKAFGKDLA